MRLRYNQKYAVGPTRDQSSDRGATLPEGTNRKHPLSSCATRAIQTYADVTFFHIEAFKLISYQGARSWLKAKFRITTIHCFGTSLVQEPRTTVPQCHAEFLGFGTLELQNVALCFKVLDF